jgi:hypothetical protein
MRTLALPIAFIAVFCALFTATTYADALIFNNSNYTGYVYAPDYSYTEMLDYGTSQGGRISKFVFGYASGSSAGTIWVRFYQGTDRYDTGYLIRQFALTAVPGTNGYVDTYEYVIPEDQRFELPSGDFGYSFTFSSSATDIALATGGAGVDRYFWEDLYGTGVLWPVYFDVAYNFYFQVYTAPPINEVTCDIAGYKFNDLNANGIWEAGEPNLPGWEIYVDANNNNQYDPGTDPNAVTDPNGMYFFENLPSPATYTIREVLPNGWTQTLPGSASGYEYIIATEPNHLYGPYIFGNTEQVIPAAIKLYGYIETVDGEPVPGVRVQTDAGSTSFSFDDTDAQGYYEITVPAPFTGAVSPSESRWQQNTWSSWHTNLTTDYQQDFEMLYLYAGGDGSGSTPFEIFTAEQLDYIGRQNFWHSDKHFVLMDDVDLSAYPAADFHIMGLYHQATGYKSFKGVFDGNGHTIANFTHLLPNNMVPLYEVGLFGRLEGADACIKNLGLINPHVKGDDCTGALLGFLGDGTVSHCWVQGGQVTGYYNAGGLIGKVNGGAVMNSCARDGLVTCKFTGGGGFVGENSGAINNCYSSFEVEGVYNSGPSYEGLGGFVGNAYWGTIANCYSTGLVTRDGLAGGFCAYSYDGTFTGCFWDHQTSGMTTSDGGTGLTTESMQMMSTYAGWDFDTVWRMCDGMNYPRLQWEPKPVGDFVCPEGVELTDLMVLCDEWLMEAVPLSADIAPPGAPDGKVNLLDFALFAENWLTGTDQ